MGVLHPLPGPHPVHTLHRVSAASLGGFLIVFGIVGLVGGLSPFTGRSESVLGMSSNGLLSVLSLVAGALLVLAATRTGPAASTTSMLAGVLFLLSGMVNLLVLDTSMNLLAFRLSNVIFSAVVGLLLLAAGAYGRISCGLPPGNPYRVPSVDPPPPALESPGERLRNAVARAELAEAERADALHFASPDQYRRLAVVHQYRSAEDRLRAWQLSARSASLGQAAQVPRPRPAEPVNQPGGPTPAR